MARNEIGNIRRSQAVGVHGPGAIVDFRAGGRGATVSAVIAGLELWDEKASKEGLENEQVIFEPRLQRELGVDGFRLPPVTPEIAPGVPAKNADRLVAVRFPMWLQCPKCSMLQRAKRWSEHPGDPAPYCAPCTDEHGERVSVVPVRFIQTCDRGHLDEFPWDFWVQHKGDCKKKRLRLEASGKAGLAGLVLKCTGCKQHRSMEGCFDKKMLVPLGGCAGRRPWLPSKPESCDADARIVQRGASNLYFSVGASALDIPPWSDPIQKKMGKNWAEIREAKPEERPMWIKLLKLETQLGLPAEHILAEINKRIDLDKNPTQDGLLWEEYLQLIVTEPVTNTESEFQLRPQQVPKLIDWIDRVSVVNRLREVRAVRGFTRIQVPTGEDDERIAPIQIGKKNWLPAVENRGEGIFLRLNSERLSEWEQQTAVVARVKHIDEIYREKIISRTGADEPPRTITPRLLLVHTLTHAIIRQLSLDCGYASASLRERLYVASGDIDMAGLLIYTATPDSDGTLGGLARQGLPENILRVVTSALAAHLWCSSDPLCAEGTIALSHQLNGAACHACVLIAETSCEEFNCLLDRAMLVGLPSTPGLGFFQEFLGQRSD